MKIKLTNKRDTLFALALKAIINLIVPFSIILIYFLGYFIIAHLLFLGYFLFYFSFDEINSFFKNKLYFVTPLVTEDDYFVWFGRTKSGINRIGQLKFLAY